MLQLSVLGLYLAPGVWSGTEAPRPPNLSSHHYLVSQQQGNVRLFTAVDIKQTLVWDNKEERIGRRKGKEGSKWVRGGEEEGVYVSDQERRKEGESRIC